MWHSEVRTKYLGCNPISLDVRCVPARPITPLSASSGLLCEYCETRQEMIFYYHQESNFHPHVSNRQKHTASGSAEDEAASQTLYGGSTNENGTANKSSNRHVGDKLAESAATSLGEMRVPKSVNVVTLKSMYKKNIPITMVTAYDAPSALYVSFSLLSFLVC
tara:strand:+ start:73 stop:561 length:489 start_codon:yes stop_codon:yes gene_type:complete